MLMAVCRVEYGTTAPMLVMSGRMLDEKLSLSGFCPEVPATSSFRAPPDGRHHHSKGTAYRLSRHSSETYEDVGTDSYSTRFILTPPRLRRLLNPPHPLPLVPCMLFVILAPSSWELVRPVVDGGQGGGRPERGAFLLAPGGGQGLLLGRVDELRRVHAAH